MPGDNKWKNFNYRSDEELNVKKIADKQTKDTVNKTRTIQTTRTYVCFFEEEITCFLN